MIRVDARFVNVAERNDVGHAIYLTTVPDLPEQPHNESR
jgi:hypothetical protein